MDMNEMFWHLFNNDISAIQPPHGQEITEQRGVDGNQGNDVEMNIVMNNQHDVGNSLGINKKRKKQSKVWEEMTKFTEDGRDWARCNYCKKKFDGSSKKGTTHLKNHLDRCRPKTSNGGEDAGKSMDQATNLTSSIAIEEKPVIDLIKDCFENPIHGYWDPSVLNSRKAEIHQVYGEEKEKLLRVFKELSCCFNLKMEELRGWYVLRVCYIDNNWEQKQKIISVHDVVEDGEVDHNYQNLVKILIESCLDLKIDGNICYITYHCRPGSDNFVRGDHEDVVGEINSRFGQRDNSLPFVGVLFSFYALSLIYYNFEKKFIKWLWNTFGGIRKCINYVNSRRSNRRSLRIAAGKAKSMGKKANISLSFPISASYFDDFDGALSYKAALRELERIDSDFKSRSINLTKKRWNDATSICRDYRVKGQYEQLLQRRTCHCK